MKPRAIALAAGVSCLSFALAALPRGASQGDARPRFTNTQVQQRPAEGGLANALGSALREHASASWIAYSVPSTPGDHGLCDADRPRRVYLEGRPARASVQDSAGPTVDMIVLLRVEDGRLQRLRVASVNCEVDGGGLPVVWLTGVRGAESVSLLRSLVGASTPLPSAGVREGSVLMAIALHADPSAGRALEELAAPGQPPSLRKQAVFWLGAGRGAVDTLIRLARNDESLDIRKEAMFWLSRSQDQRAIAFTEEILKK